MQIDLKSVGCDLSDVEAAVLVQTLREAVASFSSSIEAMAVRVSKSTLPEVRPFTISVIAFGEELGMIGLEEAATTPSGGAAYLARRLPDTCRRVLATRRPMRTLRTALSSLSSSSGSGSWSRLAS